MNFDSLKLDYLAHKIQLISFDKSGMVIDSCNSIVKFEKGSNLFDEIIFLESIKESILTFSPQESLNFSCIANPFDKDGIYDFTFDKNSKGDITWFICDFTPQYSRLKDLQQGRNESVIRKEKLSGVNKKLKIEKNLLATQVGNPSHTNKSNIFIKIDSLLVNFNLEDIYLAEAYGDYVKILDKNKRYHVIYSTLSKVEDKLPITDFVRVHRSFVVRLDAIENVDNNNLVINDKIVPISKKYKSEFLERLNTL